MADCEQCAVLQRQNDFLANDRDGYVRSLTDDNNKLRAEVERLKELTVKADEAIARQQQDLEGAADQAADCDILRAEALEEAAKVCDPKGDCSEQDAYGAAFAAAIRAMKGKQ